MVCAFLFTLPLILKNIPEAANQVSLWPIPLPQLKQGYGKILYGIHSAGGPVTRGTKNH